MVEQVQAWKDAAGNLHATRVAATEADARNALIQISAFNQAIVNSLIDEAPVVVSMLQPFVDALAEESK